MPRCEVCDEEQKPEKLFRDLDTDVLCCEGCADGRRIVSVPRKDLIFGRTYDYSVSYTREKGLEAKGRLGGAKITLEVDQNEFSRVFGAPEK
jgi:hypothetical protein